MENEIILEAKKVGDIKGKFNVPSYQRGYRWGKPEITRLLDDVYNNGKHSYCLQPIVVRRSGDVYDLVDGQQRLTTLYLIYCYMKKVNSFFPDPAFSITYTNRDRSEEFLKNIDVNKREENIDFWFISNAYESIKNWFETDNEMQIRVMHIFEYFKEDVKVIWYEVGEIEDKDTISLFTRLNIGKIPLTSAELVKAMFLNKDTGIGINKEKQDEISLQWDNMERELHNDSLWYFLTNKTNKQYQTRIDLVLDIMTNKSPDNREKYYTFFKFDEMRKENPLSLEKTWTKIYRTFLILKDWFENHEWYHKIGYLIASNTLTLQQIFNESAGKTKEAFRKNLDEFIRGSISIKCNYSELSYEKTSDYHKISTLLLLFNVESMRQNGEHTQWFPFDKFKFSKGNKVSWSLEHIHAQRSEGMRKQEEWKEWLRLHIPSLKSIGSDHTELISAMQAAVDKEKLERTEFDSLQQQAVELLSAGGNMELHSISNLALLNTNDNAALNNSTFDVKRNEIIEMDKKGQYIPFCTKLVFLKYYTPSSENQLHFWGYADRAAYIDAINQVLENYLEEPISFEKEEK